MRAARTATLVVAVLAGAAGADQAAVPPAVAVALEALQSQVSTLSASLARSDAKIQSLEMAVQTLQTQVAAIEKTAPPDTAASSTDSPTVRRLDGGVDGGGDGGGGEPQIIYHREIHTSALSSAPASAPAPTRQLQGADNCTRAEVPQRVNAITAECCDEAT